MQEALLSLAILAEDRMPNGRVPATPRILQRVNIFLSRITPQRDVRLSLLSDLFNQPLTTSKQLTNGQAVALLSLAYPNGGIVPDSSFVHYLEGRCHDRQPIPELY